ncbi:hypothetical protein HCX48_13070 [Rhodocyclus tenuis]|uniref:Apea-like HEPN domain-containing protein n=1 Tax=Rhodocyclus gracilis TaxID=2929842 RepID=A0ABX0WK93_9RHOO|nr:hypothetical protein [Rhodocyclus gracilis]NJA90145.1 hypothetical protein [Rhodocyclus gracilis]
MLTERFCEELGLSAGSSSADLFLLIEQSGRDPLDGLLVTEEAREAALAFLRNISGYGVRVVKQLALTQQKYCKVQIDGETSPVLVALMKDCAEDLPTEMENLILLAILQDKFNFGSAWRDGPGGRVLKWRGETEGLAIVAEPLPHKREVARTVAALFSLEDAGFQLPVAPPSIAQSSSNINIGSPARHFSEVQGRLVFEAASVTHPKWRFLSLYRILENAYLRSIKEALLEEFDKDANKAVEDARKKLTSEINQLVNLMKSQKLDSQFIAFNDEFEKQLLQRNRYVTALDKTAELESGFGNRDVAVKAVVRFYKMRCSIAHAGTSSVIYEQLPDANAAVIDLLPAVEAIVHGSLNISLP